MMNNILIFVFIFAISHLNASEFFTINVVQNDTVLFENTSKIKSKSVGFGYISTNKNYDLDINYISTKKYDGVIVDFDSNDYNYSAKSNYMDINVFTKFIKKDDFALGSKISIVSHDNDLNVSNINGDTNYSKNERIIEIPIGIYAQKTYKNVTLFYHYVLDNDIRDDANTEYQSREFGLSYIFEDSLYFEISKYHQPEKDKISFKIGGTF